MAEDASVRFDRRVRTAYQWLPTDLQADFDWVFPDIFHKVKWPKDEYTEEEIARLVRAAEWIIEATDGDITFLDGSVWVGIRYWAEIEWEVGSDCVQVTRFDKQESLGMEVVSLLGNPRNVGELEEMLPDCVRVHTAWRIEGCTRVAKGRVR